MRRRRRVAQERHIGQMEAEMLEQQRLGAVPDHADRDIKDDQEADPGDPAVAVQQAGDEARSNESARPKISASK